jgi:four helix bundle protein
MLKPAKNPYGYQNLLAYKKAEELQMECRRISGMFPRSKTIIDLADQMDRSSRSGKQNIVEGWKRNTTKEYFDFLGFSIGAVAELEEDCNDIWKGRYPELEGIMGVMGEERVKGVGMGIKGEKGSPFNPLSPSNPNNSSNPNPFSSPDRNNIPGSNNLFNPFKSNEQIKPFSSSNPNNHSNSNSNPFSPFKPFISPFDIEKLPFYPLDQTLPPIVQLKLRCKELNYLLYKLQTSLENKMKSEKTLPASAMARERLQEIKKGSDAAEEFLCGQGFRRLENGQVVLIKDPKKQQAEAG